VTGSGKTEVYLHAISALAKHGNGAIVLVPEIALTPQLLARFRGRFGRPGAVLHSGLTDRERADEYRRIRRGRWMWPSAAARYSRLSGRSGSSSWTKSMRNSYKQDEGLRYSARDVAIMRAKLLNAVAVLGFREPRPLRVITMRDRASTTISPGRPGGPSPHAEVAVIDVRPCPGLRSIRRCSSSISRSGLPGTNNLSCC